MTLGAALVALCVVFIGAFFWAVLYFFFLKRKAKNTLTLLVNYSRSIEDGIKGKYDWANPNINSKNFPVTEIGTKEVPIQLLHFNRTMSTDQVIAEMDEQNLRPANLQECLAFGEKYPDVQRQFPIIFLGSVWRSFGGYRYCPDLDGRGSLRFLDLVWFDSDWFEVCRFAAVSK